MTPADPAERIKTIIRRDLKFGPDIQITEDMPFFGTDADVDSLDILLLLTSIEKEFGVKVPSEKVGREIFENVGTLVAFVAQQQAAKAGGGVGAAAGGGTGASLDDYLNRLPHGPEFRFVSRVTAVQPDVSSAGVWTLSGKEQFFAGHFPGKPIVPGVLIAESLAQLAGMALPAPATATTGKGVDGRLAHVDVRFEQPVAPPAEITLKAKVLRTMGTLTQFEVEASVGQTVVARGTLALSCGPVPV